MSNTGRIGFAALAIALVVILFIVLSPGGDDEEPAFTPPPTSDSQTNRGTDDEKKKEKPKPPPEAEPETIVVSQGGVEGGVKELEFENGETIEFVVESDVADEVHLHGYDVSKEVPAGGKVEFSVPADIEGKFEVELEHAVIPIAEVTVTPG